MQTVMTVTMLRRWMTLAVVLLGVACFLGLAGASAPVYSQDPQPEAKGEKDGEEKKGGPESLLQSPMLVMIAIMVLFFFFIILPAQRRQKREQESVLANLKKNDEVVTAAGIIGIVTIIKDLEDEVTLKIDDNARIKVLKSSIVRIRTKEEPKDIAGSPDTNIKPAT